MSSQINNTFITAPTSQTHTFPDNLTIWIKPEYSRKNEMIRPNYTTKC